MDLWLNSGLIEWLQGLGDGLLPIMKFFSLLGTEMFYLLILPVLLWCYDVRFGLRVGTILLSSGSLNLVIKTIVGWPRPYWVNENVRALGSDPYFGLPSGHAQNSVSLFGRIGALLQDRWLRLSLISIIFLISLSRLYLGVHFPLDVLVGWAIGALLLFLFIRLEPHFLAWYAKRSQASRVLVPALASFAILLTGLWVTSVQEFPTSWSALASAAAPGAEPINPTAIEPFISGAGIFLGFGVGAVLLTDWGRFDTAGPVWQLALRYVAGLLGVVVLFLGLRAIFPQGESAPALAFRYVRYAAVGLWITFLGPKSFVRFGLAESKPV